MNCPLCGNTNAVMLLTSIRCSNKQCQNFDGTLAAVYSSETDRLYLHKYHPNEKVSFGIYQLSTQGTKTGRFSCNQPNISNLPSKKTLFSERVARINKLWKSFFSTCDETTKSFNELSKVVSKLNFPKEN